MRELVCGKCNPTARYIEGFEGTDLVQRTSPPRMPMPCQERLCKRKLYQPIDEQQKLGSFLFLYIVVRLCKQAFNTIYYVQKRVETDISTLFAHHSFSRTFSFAESEGFEPPVQRNVYTAFRVRLFRPLRQLSSIAGAKVQQFFELSKIFAIFCKKITIRARAR